MKMFAMLAAGLLGAAAMAPVSATAAPVSAAPVAVEAGVAPQVVERRTTVIRENRYRRGPRWRTRRVCENRYRRGHRERVCRTVRYCR